MSSEAEFMFRSVMDSPGGTFAVKEFQDRKQADSFRTRLYRAKSKFNDLSVEVSVSGNTVKVKKSEELGFKLFSKENEEIQISKEKVENSRWEKLKQEVLEDIEGFNYSQELIDELLAERRAKFERTGE